MFGNTSLFFLKKTNRVCVKKPQRHGRFQETQLKCTKARNDYLLNLAASNAAMNKYYLQDVSTLIDVRTVQRVSAGCSVAQSLARL